MIDFKKYQTSVIWGGLLILFSMILSLFIFKMGNDFVFVLLTVFWFFYCQKFNIEARLSVLAGLGFLVFCPLFMLVYQVYATGFASWAFLLILSGTILSLKEFNFGNKIK